MSRRFHAHLQRKMARWFHALTLQSQQCTSLNAEVAEQRREGSERFRKPSSLSWHVRTTESVRLHLRTTRSPRTLLFRRSTEQTTDTWRLSYPYQPEWAGVRPPIGIEFQVRDQNVSNWRTWDPKLLTRTTQWPAQASADRVSNPLRCPHCNRSSDT